MAAAPANPHELTARMWDERNFADAQIICGTRSFAVHRNVLCASSLEFTNLFNNARDVARIEIHDCSPEAIEALLKYIYKGEAPGALAVEVLPLAARLELPRLMKVCGEDMIERLSPETAPAIVHALKDVKYVGSMMEIWYEVQNKVRQDKDMVDALMMKVEC
jgi:hypothetical protein